MSTPTKPFALCYQARPWRSHIASPALFATQLLQQHDTNIIQLQAPAQNRLCGWSIWQWANEAGRDSAGMGPGEASILDRLRGLELNRRVQMTARRGEEEMKKMGRSLDAREMAMAGEVNRGALIGRAGAGLHHRRYAGRRQTAAGDGKFCGGPSSPLLLCNSSPAHPITMLNRLFRPQSGLRAASAFSQVSWSPPMPGGPRLTDRPPQKPVSALPRFQVRSLHRVPQLSNDQYFKDNGVPELLSPEAFDFSWTQYQGLLIDKLNLMTQGRCALGFSSTGD